MTPEQRQQVEDALAAHREAEDAAAAALAALHAAIARAAATGGRGTQAELARLTGYSRERLRQIGRRS